MISLQAQRRLVAKEIARVQSATPESASTEKVSRRIERREERNSQTAVCHCIQKTMRRSRQKQQRSIPQKLRSASTEKHRGRNSN